MSSPIAPLTEAQARLALERLRWPHGVRCARCRSERVSPIQGGREGLYQCKACRQQFTATVGTIMHRSHIPIRTWLLAAQFMSASKKGVSALQLQRMLGLGSYKTAWHLAHRLRRGMETPKKALPLRGTVEVDETFVGGKGRMETKRARHTPVVAMIEREGAARAKAIHNTKIRTLKIVLRKNINPGAILMTDEYQAYESLAPIYGGHETVKHSAGEYARGRIHINTTESFFAIFKRGIHGSYHHISRQHLFRYCDEFAFRWTHRLLDDRTRSNTLMGHGLEKKPLRIAELTNGGNGHYKGTTASKG